MSRFSPRSLGGAGLVGVFVMCFLLTGSYALWDTDQLYECIKEGNYRDCTGENANKCKSRYYDRKSDSYKSRYDEECMLNLVDFAIDCDNIDRRDKLLKTAAKYDREQAFYKLATRCPPSDVEMDVFVSNMAKHAKKEENKLMVIKNATKFLLLRNFYVGCSMDNVRSLLAAYFSAKHHHLESIVKGLEYSAPSFVYRCSERVRSESSGRTVLDAMKEMFDGFVEKSMDSEGGFPDMVKAEVYNDMMRGDAARANAKLLSYAEVTVVAVKRKLNQPTMTSHAWIETMKKDVAFMLYGGWSYPQRFFVQDRWSRQQKTLASIPPCGTLFGVVGLSNWKLAIDENGYKFNYDSIASSLPHVFSMVAHIKEYGELTIQPKLEPTVHQKGFSDCVLNKPSASAFNYVISQAVNTGDNDKYQWKNAVARLMQIKSPTFAGDSSGFIDLAQLNDSVKFPEGMESPSQFVDCIPNARDLVIPKKGWDEPASALSYSLDSDMIPFLETKLDGNFICKEYYPLQFLRKFNRIITASIYKNAQGKPVRQGTDMYQFYEDLDKTLKTAPHVSANLVNRKYPFSEEALKGKFEGGDAKLGDGKKAIASALDTKKSWKDAVNGFEAVNQYSYISSYYSYSHRKQAYNLKMMDPLAVAIKLDIPWLEVLLLRYGAERPSDAEAAKALKKSIAMWLDYGLGSCIDSDQPIEGCASYIRRGASLSGRVGDTPMVFLADSSLERVRWVLEAGLKERVTLVNQRGVGNFKGQTLMMEAVNKGDVELLELLAEFKADASLVDDKSETALHMAAMYGRAELVPKLVDLGAPLEAVSSKGLTALKMAVEAELIDTAEALIKSGAEYNANSPGDSVLSVGCKTKSPDMIRFLLDEGARFKSDAGAEECLILLADSGSNESFRMVHAKYPEVSLELSLDTAIKSKYTNADIVDTCLSRISCENGEMPLRLIRAIDAGNPAVVRTLGKKCPALLDPRKFTKATDPLYRAVSKGDLECLQVLIEIDPDVTVRVDLNPDFRDLITESPNIADMLKGEDIIAEDQIDDVIARFKKEYALVPKPATYKDTRERVSDVATLLDLMNSDWSWLTPLGEPQKPVPGLRGNLDDTQV